MYILLFIFIWAVVAAGLHLHRGWYYRQNPLAYNRRGEGLIAFSDRQYWWIMSLWPLAIVALILYAILITVAAIIEGMLELKRR